MRHDDDTSAAPGTAPHEAPDDGVDRAVDLTPTPGPRDGSEGASGADVLPDPLRLCIFATVALVSWLAGPWALAFFAGLGAVGYARARRAGLLRSRCLLGDTRLVLLYLGVLFGVAVWFAVRQVTG